MRDLGMRVAITGGPGEGKSFVLRYLLEAGYRCKDADEVVAEIWEEPETPYDLGHLLGFDGPVGRDLVRKLVFGNAEARRKLNGYFHQSVMDRLLECDADFVEVPLLVESCSFSLFERVWVVACGPEAQHQRLSERGLNEDQIHDIVRSHLPSRVKQAFSDLVIRTDRAQESVYEQIDNALRGLVRSGAV